MRRNTSEENLSLLLGNHIFWSLDSLLKLLSDLSIRWSTALLYICSTLIWIQIVLTAGDLLDPPASSHNPFPASAHSAAQSKHLWPSSEDGSWVLKPPFPLGRVRDAWSFTVFLPQATLGWMIFWYINTKAQLHRHWRDKYWGVS